MLLNCNQRKNPLFAPGKSGVIRIIRQYSSPSMKKAREEFIKGVISQKCSEILLFS